MDQFLNVLGNANVAPHLIWAIVVTIFAFLVFFSIKKFLSTKEEIKLIEIQQQKNEIEDKRRHEKEIINLQRDAKKAELDLKIEELEKLKSIEKFELVKYGEAILNKLKENNLKTDDFLKLLGELKNNT